ncbi:MAG: hypothetical protein KC636_09935, partial [Myxococcales bacterium]|nr:hypothetical protein [Myxococcales bacterium]
AAFLVALADACAAVAAGRCGQAVVGGVDSRCAPEVVTELAADERLLGPDNRDGLLPGEAAVFVTLERAERGRERAPAVLGVATADEPASFDSGDVNLSTGLSAAFAALRARVDRRVDLVISAQTGETCWAREFSAASLRHAPLMPEPLRTAIVARSFGDAGAAAGGLALVLACLGASGQRTLVHASADAGRVAAAVVVAPRRPLDPVGERVGLWRRAPDVAATPAVASLVEDRVTSHLEVLGMRLAALQRDAVRPADDQAVAARLRAIAVYGPPALECVRRRQADLDADVRAGAAFTLATLR